MKKLNFAILGTCLLTALTTRALAETTIPWTKEGCESVKGTWITAHSPDESGCNANHCNGRNFCRSNVMMNWWSALIWCKSIGRELTDIETACPRGLSSSSCANLKSKGGGNCWMSDVTSNPSWSYFVAHDGTIHFQSWTVKTRTEVFALCK